MSQMTSLREKVNQREEVIRALADSDARCAKYAKALLDLADGSGGGD